MNKTLANQMKILGQGLKSHSRRNSATFQEKNGKILQLSKTPTKADKENDGKIIVESKVETTPNIKENKTPLITEKTSNQLAKSYLKPNVKIQKEDSNNLKENLFKPIKINQKENGKKSPEKAKLLDNAGQNLSNTVKKLRFDNEIVTKNLNKGADIIKKVSDKNLTASFLKLKKLDKNGKKFNTQNVNYGKISTGPLSAKTVEELHLKSPGIALITKMVQDNTIHNNDRSDKKTVKTPANLHRKTMTEFDEPLMLSKNNYDNSGTKNNATDRPNRRSNLMSPPQNINLDERSVSNSRYGTRNVSFY